MRELGHKILSWPKTYNYWLMDYMFDLGNMALETMSLATTQFSFSLRKPVDRHVQFAYEGKN